MSEFEPDLTEVARTDLLVDALAAGEPAEFADADDHALGALLADWRDELRWPPASAPVSEPEAVAALQRGLAQHPGRRRVPAFAGTAAAALLALGGFGAMVGGAQPGDALYGVHTVLLGEPPSVHDDNVALTAKTELEQVQQMINQGQWDQAQDKLASVSDRVQTVNDTDRKQDLVDQVNQLNAKVANRDPNATAAPSSLPNPAVAPAISVSQTTIPPEG